MSDALYQSVLAMADRNEDCRNIFVRKVPFAATSKELREAFAQFGTIQECQIIVDKMTGESKGFGFVKFDSISSALKAVNSKVYMGAMELNLTIANPNAKSRSFQQYFTYRVSLQSPWRKKAIHPQPTIRSYRERLETHFRGFCRTCHLQ